MVSGESTDLYLLKRPSCGTTWKSFADQIRIEDNILITKDGSLNLTDAVKDPEELERIISSAK